MCFNELGKCNGIVNAGLCSSKVEKEKEWMKGKWDVGVPYSS
jgi:hypothetical protein